MSLLTPSNMSVKNCLPWLSSIIQIQYNAVVAVLIAAKVIVELYRVAR